MKIKLRLHDSLKNQSLVCAVDSESNWIYIALPQKSDINGLINFLGLDSVAIGLVIVNARQVNYQQKLYNGDAVELFSPMAGG